MDKTVGRGSMVAWQSVGAACLAAGFSACSGSSEEPSYGPLGSACPLLAPAELSTLDAEVHVIASGAADGGGVLGEAASLSRSLLPDGEDVYWYDGQGSVFVERQSNGLAVELRHAEPPGETQREIAIGLAANAERLFVGHAQEVYLFTDSLEPNYYAPGRLLSLSKQNGQAEVLLESEDYWMAPLAADSERVIVFALGEHADGTRDAGLYQVRLADPRLEPLPLAGTLTGLSESPVAREVASAFRDGLLVGNQMYWVSRESPPRLLRAGFDDTEPEVLMSAPGSSLLSVGPGYVMTEETVFLRTETGARYDGLHFMLRDDSGCRSVAGPLGGQVLDTALDAESAYWVGATARAFADPPRGELAVTRIDLASGALTRVNPLGLEHSDTLRIVGHDDARIFLYGEGKLASLRKP